MQIKFKKYHGTGNDFILVDNRENHFPSQDNKLVAKLCDRHFGIGADGLILLEEDEHADFKMVYFNADGGLGSLCGNGARCTVKFAESLGLVDGEVRFNAFDGLHKAGLKENEIWISMNDVPDIQINKYGYFIDTGSPHVVKLVERVNEHPVVEQGSEIRNSIEFQPGGTNVNFIEVVSDSSIKVRTFERGVEAETLSCGTGVVASSLAFAKFSGIESGLIIVHAIGGSLSVSFKKNGSIWSDIKLSGSVTKVYSGVINI